MISHFTKLAQTIEKSWEIEGFSKEKFSKISYDALTDFNYDASRKELESSLTEWFLNQDTPKQLNLYNTFGQPPVTVFNNSKFVIDLYFWTHVDTSLHSHSFSGAFKVLFGRSVHETFKFDVIKKYSSDVVASRLTALNKKLIHPGETVEILRGNEFNHRLIHLDNPTITLCVRTCNDQDSAQWHHFNNGLSIEKRATPEDLIKKFSFANYLLLQGSSEYQSFISQVCSQLSHSILLNFYEQVSMDQMGLELELIEFFFGYVQENFSDEEWFQIYCDYYEQMQDAIELGGSTSVDRFLEHAINEKYSREAIIDMIEKIQGESPLPSQLELLSMHLNT